MFCWRIVRGQAKVAGGPLIDHLILSFLDGDPHATFTHSDGDIIPLILAPSPFWTDSFNGPARQVTGNEACINSPADAQTTSTKIPIHDCSI